MRCVCTFFLTFADSMRHILTLLGIVLVTAVAARAQGVDEFYDQNPTQDYTTRQRTTGCMDQPQGFDPNLWVFLCLGQSNMEGNAQAEDVDMQPLSPRFMMLSAVDMPKQGRRKGEWYVAYPPLCGEHYGLSPADYFGRTLVQQLPDSIRIAVINVAIGGASIDLYDETRRETYLATAPQWLRNKCLPYDDNPYRRLMQCAVQAQQHGVIRGILLHQGCTDNGQRDWPQRVDTVYTRMLRELHLQAEDVPLLVGELMSQQDGGACWLHNSIIATLPLTIPTAHVVPSLGCEGKPDHLHFTAAGYRELGRRYAQVMLPLLTRPQGTPPSETPQTGRHRHHHHHRRGGAER